MSRLSPGGSLCFLALLARVGRTWGERCPEVCQEAGAWRGGRGKKPWSSACRRACRWRVWAVARAAACTSATSQQRAAGDISATGAAAPTLSLSLPLSAFSLSLSLFLSRPLFLCGRCFEALAFLQLSGMARWWRRLAGFSHQRNSEEEEGGRPRGEANKWEVTQQVFYPLRLPPPSLTRPALGEKG